MLNSSFPCKLSGLAAAKWYRSLLTLVHMR